MKKYEYMMEIEHLRRIYENGDIDTSTCQLNISDIIMRAWNDSKINGRDMVEILKLVARVINIKEKCEEIGK